MQRQFSDALAAGPSPNWMIWMYLPLTSDQTDQDTLSFLISVQEMCDLVATGEKNNEKSPGLNNQKVRIYK